LPAHDVVEGVVALAQGAKDRVDEPPSGSGSTGDAGDGDDGGDGGPLDGPGARQTGKVLDEVRQTSGEVSEALTRR